MLIKRNERNKNVYESEGDAKKLALDKNFYLNSSNRRLVIKLKVVSSFQVKILQSFLVES